MAQTTLRDYLQTTEDAINTGEIGNALTNCQHILTHFPELVEAQRLLGEVYLAQGYLDEAQHTFDWVLTNDPENVIVYCSRALVSERKAEYDTALDCYQQAYELSRGNSQIRQEFNQLSAKVGQQGFIFSRAGLARLYMRGDLLSQAIQEWETVLTMTPDRLDARTGLLEAYWREGSYDRVEQLATEILKDVPGCLKALLLLAHVTFTQNALQSQELIQRAADLDPDLIMAQELFSDFIVNHPKDPFLALLKKAPAVLPATTGGHSTDHGTAASQPSTTTGTNSTSLASTLSDPLSRWSSLDNIIEPQQDYQTMHDASPFAAWGNNSSAAPERWNEVAQQDRSTPPREELRAEQAPASDLHLSSAFDTWNTLNPPEQLPEPEAPVQPTPPSNGRAEHDIWSTFDQGQPPAHVEATHRDQSLHSQTDFSSWGIFGQDEEASSSQAPSDLGLWNTLDREVEEAPPPQEVWHMPQDTHQDSTAAHPQDQEDNEQEQPSHSLDTFTEPYVDGWPAMPASKQETADTPWQTGEKAGNQPVLPTWLDMLTNSERRQPSGSLPQQGSTPAVPSTTRITRELVEPEIESAAQTSPQPSSGEDEPFFFGPEWLKSLGATAMDSPFSSEEEDVETPPQALPSAQPTTTDEAQTLSAYEADVDAPTASFTDEEAMLDWTLSLTSEPPTSEASSDEPSLPEITAASTPLELEVATTRIDAAAVDELASTSVSTTPQVAPEPPEQPARPASFNHWLDHAVHRLTQSDQNMLTTLEELEQDLQSQGFMPLERGALSSITQNNRSEPDTSSAVAQFGNYAAQPVRQEQPTSQPHSVQGTAPEITQHESVAEPLWPATSPSISQPSTAPSQVTSKPQNAPPVPVSHLEALSNYVSRPAPSPQPKAKPEPVGTEAFSSLVSSTAPSPAFHAPAPPPAVPAQPTAQSTTAMDTELETTMKRPAVRLQTIQQRPTTSQGQAPAKAQAGNGNRSSGSKASEGQLSYKDRLLKGYQYQLAGAYDDAMQEYRMIIRHAPELLSEVISNMRALLKLAPKYSPGYRVLGDAYMRQGEYLQAMEAYNKALTMAKKAKG